MSNIFDLGRLIGGQDQKIPAERAGCFYVIQGFREGGPEWPLLSLCCSVLRYHDTRFRLNAYTKVFAMEKDLQGDAVREVFSRALSEFQEYIEEVYRLGLEGKGADSINERIAGPKFQFVSGDAFAAFAQMKEWLRNLRKEAAA